MGEKKLNWALRNPIRNGYIGAITTVAGISSYYLGKGEALQYAPVIMGGLGTFTGAIFLTLLANKTKISLKTSSKQMDKTPICQFKGEQKIRYGFLDYSRLFFASKPQQVEKIARKTKNPLVALDAMILYSGKYNNFLEGITLLRDAFDWMDGNKPELSFSTKVSQLNQKFAFSISRFFQPYKTETYLMQAMYESITNPENAHHWTEIAKTISKETNKLIPESHLLHALLATAQKRTDEETAWEDVLEQCDMNSKREYLGESQNPVWTINSSDLLKSTIVLKGDSSRQNLELERKGAQTLEKILENAEPPTPLFISNLPVEGNYIYVMRTSEGDLLYDRLESGSKVGLSAVEDTLAQIHAKYPLEGLSRLDLEQKIKKKTKDLGLDEDFSNALILATEPVRKAISETGNWAAAKDAHPENWILAHKVYVLDTLIKEIQPTNLDLANLYNYGNHFTQDEKRERTASYDERFAFWSKKEKKPAQILFREYWNAEIQRAIDLTAAWMTPKRKTRHSHIIPLFERAQLSIQNLKHDDLTYYEKNEAEYDKLNVLINKLKEHVTPYIS